MHTFRKPFSKFSLLRKILNLKHGYETHGFSFEMKLSFYLHHYLKGLKKEKKLADS